MSACAVDTSKPPRLGYAPPSVEPAAPGLASAGQPADLIWNQLLDRLIQSPLQVSLTDAERGIVVARYSGDPEPYVTCGWILVDRGGELEQVPAHGESTFRRSVDGRRLDVNRGLQLDARLVVEVEPDRDGAIVKTNANYVLTKTVVAQDLGGWTHGRAQEVISFSSGERGSFAKGTVCQPNGALERTVLDVLPRVAGTQRGGGGRRASIGRAAATGAPAETMPAASLAPAAGPQVAESAVPASTGETAEGGGSASLRPTPVVQAEIPIPEVPEGLNLDDQGTPFECQIDDQMFCEVVDLTDPYRRANRELDLGLALDALEGDNPLLEGNGLGLDISLPNYDSYLAVSYFMKDGTVRHVLSGSYRRWPAHAREFVSDAGLSADDRQSVEMVVALASDVPVFPSPRPGSETAELYLGDLRERLSEVSNGDSPAQIAASLIVVTPAQPASF